MKLNRRSAGMSCSYCSRTAPLHHHFYFYEKSSGGASFQIESGKDGQFPLEKAVSLLAMHCMVRGLSPRDYVVFVPIGERELEGFYERTTRLLQAGQSLNSRIRLTRREEQVLSRLQINLSNKEIAFALNLSERTVKFHVSSLLAKLRVRNRIDLASQAWRCLPPGAPGAFPVASPPSRPAALARVRVGKPAASAPEDRATQVQTMA